MKELESKPIEVFQGIALLSLQQLYNLQTEICRWESLLEKTHNKPVTFLTHNHEGEEVTVVVSTGNLEHLWDARVDLRTRCKELGVEDEAESMIKDAKDNHKILQNRLALPVPKAFRELK